MMPRGRLSKIDIYSRVLKIYEELDSEVALSESKGLAQKYLRKVLEAIEEYSI